MNEHCNLQDKRKSAPLVSVVVDTYNHEAFIGEAITSVLQQEYQLGAVEVLVVDDGSRDGTAKQLSAFADRVRIVRKENGGQASALNLGVTLAKGDIIAFLDGDDWWHPRKLQAVVSYLLRNPAVGMVGHGIVEVAADGNQACAAAWGADPLRPEVRKWTRYFQASGLFPRDEPPDMSP